MAPLWHQYKPFWLTLAYRQLISGAMDAWRWHHAGAYASAGDLARAIPPHGRTLADRVRVLGEDHPLTATVRGNLARAVADRDDGESGQP
jgi:hypothetical protein